MSSQQQQVLTTQTPQVRRVARQNGWNSQYQYQTYNSIIQNNYKQSENRNSVSPGYSGFVPFVRSDDKFGSSFGVAARQALNDERLRLRTNQNLNTQPHNTSTQLISNKQKEKNIFSIVAPETILAYKNDYKKSYYKEKFTEPSFPTIFQERTHAPPNYEGKVNQSGYIRNNRNFVIRDLLREETTPSFQHNKSEYFEQYKERSFYPQRSILSLKITRRPQKSTQQV